MGSQVVGLVMARYVVELEPLASMPPQAIAAAITPTLERKIEALRKHKSQLAKPGREWDVEKFMRKRHRDVGKKGGYQYAESFKRITV